MAAVIHTFSLVILIFVTANGPPVYGNTPNVVSTNEDIRSNLESIQQYIDNLNYRIIQGALQTKSLVTPPIDKRFFDIRYDPLPPHCIRTAYPPRSCAEATWCTRRNGIYHIFLTQINSKPILVPCDIISHGGGWTMIFRRADKSENFDRVWSAYVKGFGNVQGDFFLGLEKLHAMTNFYGRQELLFVLKDKNVQKYAIYDNFRVGPSYESYMLHSVGAYSGDAGNSLSYHLKQKFSTRDHDNDKDAQHNCAALTRAGNWYNKCPNANDFGGKNKKNGLSWSKFRGVNEPLDYAVMMIRRRRYHVE